MFRGGQVESKNDLKVIDQMGIANLARGGRVGYKDGGTDILDIRERISEKIPRQNKLSTSDYLRIASSGLDILGAPSEGSGISGALRSAAGPLSKLGTDLAAGMDLRESDRAKEIATYTGAQADIESAKIDKFEKIERSRAVVSIFDAKIKDIDDALLVVGLEDATKNILVGKRDRLEKAKEQARLKILIPGKSDEDYIIELTGNLMKSGAYNTVQEAQIAAEEVVNSTKAMANGGRVGYAEGNMVLQEDVQMEQTPTGMEESMELTEEIKEPSVDMPYENFRERIPATVPDDIVTLIYYNPAAFADFANIDTQDDVYSFNNKYDVQLVLPLSTEAN